MNQKIKKAINNRLLEMDDELGIKITSDMSSKEIEEAIISIFQIEYKENDIVFFD